MRAAVFTFVGVLVTACSGDGGGITPPGSGGAAGSGGNATGGSAGASGGAAGASGGTGGAAGSGGAGGAAGSSGGTGGAGGLAIGEWTDAPGACPSGTTEVPLSTAQQIADASRGEGAYSGDGPGTCYLIKNGNYTSSANVLMLFSRGGSASQPIYFVGESRDGVVIHHRATFSADHLRLANMTFDLTGYSKSGSFNTITIGAASDLALSHLTLTGDCATGASGGHISTEQDGAKNILIEACLIEKFGHCSSGGHLDHGVYLSAGSDITLRNNVIRENSSRGIQLYTADGSFGSLKNVTIEQNRIYGNGHADYEDGIVINVSGAGPLAGLAVSHNLIYDNYYSGIRFAGPATSGVTIDKNTFFENGSGSSSASRSEINVDGAGAAGPATISKNILVSSAKLVNDCYDAAFSIDDNVVFGAGASGSCVSSVVSIDPKLVAPQSADFHAQSPAADGYGAYAP